MRSTSDTAFKPRPFPLPLDAKFSAYAKKSKSAKTVPKKGSLPELKRNNLSISSSSSKENGPHSLNCLSIEDSLNEGSKSVFPEKIQVFERLYSSNSRSSKGSNSSKNGKKPGSREILKNAGLNSLEDIGYVEDPNKPIPPEISARYWTVLNGKTGEVLYHKNGRRKREIASLTKMMNLLCVCKLLKEYNINPKDTHVEVSKKAASMNGTSARLKFGDILTIWDLLHGLMLPSGNDAALALAENFGTYLYINSDEYKKLCGKMPEGKVPDIKNPITHFLKLMNTTAKELDMQLTNYANPHGLANQSSYSTSNDQAILTYHLLKWDIAREVVNTREYTCNIECVDKKIKTVTWENTNKLLGKDGWFGTKTGVTNVAGPCLSAYYEKSDEAYVVILLNSSSMDIRWVEAPTIVDWAKENKEKLLEALATNNKK